jgi:hypothetical protein
MIDVRDFNKFLSQAKVTQGFGVVEYDDSYDFQHLWSNFTLT